MGKGGHSCIKWYYYGKDILTEIFLTESPKEREIDRKKAGDKIVKNSLFLMLLEAIRQAGAIWICNLDIYQSGYNIISK